LGIAHKLTLMRIAGGTVGLHQANSTATLLLDTNG
jgi:hypothetical protein